MLLVLRNLENTVGLYLVFLSNQHMESKLPRILDLDFVHVEIYDTFIVSTIKEGVTFGSAHLDAMFEVFAMYFKNKPFVSIANRVNDYTIDPNLFRANIYPDLLGIAVVYYTNTAKEVAKFEQKFYEGTYEIFSDLEDAKAWGLQLVNAHIKKAGL